MNNKFLALSVFASLIALSTIATAYAVGPPQGPPMNNSAPLKERLQAFYEAKEAYINQKRLCKEEVLITQAPSGTCWTRLKPMMINLLLNQINLTTHRLIQLRELNITFSNIDEINSQLTTAKAVFEDSLSSKYLIKSTAKNLETLINEIEATALENQTAKLITQMDNLIEKADSITVKLEAKLESLRALGVNVAELEASLNDYKAELANTKASVADAKEKYSQMSSSAEINALAAEVRTFINNAQNYLVKAFDKAILMIPNMSEGEQGMMNQTGGAE